MLPHRLIHLVFVGTPIELQMCTAILSKEKLSCHLFVNLT